MTGSDTRDDRQPAKPDGIGPISVLPVFWPLSGRRVLIAGASERAVWKAELLHATGAAVAVVATAPCAEMTALTADHPRLALHTRDWTPDDLNGVAMALIDTLDRHEAQRFREAAKTAGVPVNAIDNPDFCDFQFGAIVNRSPLVIGISTDGAAPVFGQAVRGRIETLLPRRLSAWAEAARAWRRRLTSRDLSFQSRRLFWQRFAERALAPDSGEPAESDFAACLDAVDRGGTRGRVTLVGAGPGDPELITLKAMRVLQDADVVLYDNLVAPEIVGMARREASRVDVGKRGYRPSCKQDDITALMVGFAREGKRVVRLKGGDPMIFGRANEEIEGCREAGVPVDVVPGVTAALGAAASLGISLTERTVARRLQFITAHAKDGRLPNDIDWPALCDTNASTIVYMGVRTMDALVATLLANGLDPMTPALLVERATLPDERRIAGAIAQMPDMTRDADPKGPCLLMIGQVFRAGHIEAATSHSMAEG